MPSLPDCKQFYKEWCTYDCLVWIAMSEESVCVTSSSICHWHLLLFLYVPFTVCDISCGIGELLVKNCTCAVVNICLRDNPCARGQICVLGSSSVDFTCLPQKGRHRNYSTYINKEFLCVYKQLNACIYFDFFNYNE